MWLLFAVLWSVVPPLLTDIINGPAYTQEDELANVYTEQAISRLSPNVLFGDATLALLNPATRALGPVFYSQLQGAVLGAPLPFGESLLLVWPQITGLIAPVILLFALTYVLFQRQETRA